MKMILTDPAPFPGSFLVELFRKRCDVCGRSSWRFGSRNCVALYNQAARRHQGREFSKTDFVCKDCAELCALQALMNE